MYERNAIVLEKYFDDLFKLKEPNNIVKSYKNYCELVDNLEKYNNATEDESNATFDFENITANIKKIQSTGEKLYNKSAKLEYSRYIVYENIEDDADKIKRSLAKIESDVEKNNESLKSLDEDFVTSSASYQEKKQKLANYQKINKDAKEVYEKSLKATQDVINGISEDDIITARDFLVSENKDRKKELNNILIENGKDEKNPFDVDAISNAVDVGFEIYVKEIDLLLNGYERTKKLLNEIENNDVKMDKHKKLIRDTNVKLRFLAAEKEYLVGFLDNERFAAIYEKKVHRKLMLEACRNLENDMTHVNSMYDIILKEALGRASKRLYKDNYNVEYLDGIKESTYSSDQGTNKMKTNAIAVMNLNYWRIEGLTKIQETFENDMINVYERDLADIFPERYRVHNEDENVSAQEKVKKYNSSKKALTEAFNRAEKKAEIKENNKKVDEKATSVENSVEVIENFEDCFVPLDDDLYKPEKLKEDKKAKATSKVQTEQKIQNTEKEDVKVEEKSDKSSSHKSTKDESSMPKESATNKETEVKSDADEEDAEFLKLFEQLDELDEEEEEFDYSSKTTAKQSKTEAKKEVAQQPKPEKIETQQAETKKTETKKAAKEEESILDYYFSNQDKDETKRKTRDEKHLDKETKTGIVKKLMNVNAKGKRAAKA